jgi:uncharacterized HAD superfamily protein
MIGTREARQDVLAPSHSPASAPRDAVIGIDCDGVLASDRLLWQVLRKRYPAAIPARYEDLSGYDWPRVTDDTTELCLRLSADPAFAGRLAPMPQMAEAPRLLNLAGYRLHIVTARPQAVRHATRRWLGRHGVSSYVSSIECVDRPQDKLAVVRALGCGAFVEDNHATAEALGQAGVRSYLLDAPYNQLPTRHSRRVQDWQELLDDLLGPAVALPAAMVPAVGRAG